MSEDKYPSQLADRFIVRLPDGMRDRIAEEAKKNARSMNAEIVARLEASFTSDKGVTEALEQLSASSARVEAKLAKALQLAYDNAKARKTGKE